MALVNPTADNNEGPNWTVSTQAYGVCDKGTPGEANVNIAVQAPIVLPIHFEILQNYPNPFNAVTHIRFNVTQRADVRISIHDLRGGELTVLVNGRMVAGEHKVMWDASQFPSGLYFCRLDAGEGSVTRKLLLLK